MTTVRWTLHDPIADETWTVPINPDSAGSLGRERALSHAGGWRRDQRVRSFEGKPPPRKWEFAGVIRTQAHHDEWVRWAEKRNELVLTDHLGRQMTLIIESFEPTDRRPNVRTKWRMRYTVKTTILEGP